MTSTPRALPSVPGYRIEKSIGVAGRLPLYAARRLADDLAVVVKIVGGPAVASGVERVRFEREVQILRELAHPGVIPILDHGAFGDAMFLVMPALPGGSLRSRMTALLPRVEALRVARGIADALAAAHDAGVVHRNVKPDNVLFDADGRVVLCDFGLARATKLGLSLTGDGSVVGTPRYLSPEQIHDQPTTARSDVYSLGILLFEMLAGYPPFREADYLSVALQHLTQPLPPVPDVEERLATLVAQLCAKDPQQRPASARAVVAAIDGLDSAAPA